MELTEDSVKQAIGHIQDPDTKQELNESSQIRKVSIEGNRAIIHLATHNPAMHHKQRMHDAIAFALERAHGQAVDVDLEMIVEKKQEPEEEKGIPGVRHIIAVASGKGGVGKSTVTANLAVGLAKAGYKVGLVDADIYGPSMPIMLDVPHERPKPLDIDGAQKMLPVEAYGVKLMSIGFFADAGQAIVWRGAMATKALRQMLMDTHWEELDYLLLDLPPGTGDIHLTAVQTVPLTAAVVVTTPQDIALADARKGVAMFRLPQINVPVLGIIENMSWFTPDELPDNKYYIFGKDGAKGLAEEMETDLLAQIPLVQSVREAGDGGRPAIMQDGTDASSTFAELVQTVVAAVDKRLTELPETDVVKITTR